MFGPRPTSLCTVSLPRFLQPLKETVWKFAPFCARKSFPKPASVAFTFQYRLKCLRPEQRCARAWRPSSSMSWQPSKIRRCSDGSCGRDFRASLSMHRQKEASSSTRPAPRSVNDELTSRCSAVAGLTLATDCNRSRRSPSRANARQEVDAKASAKTSSKRMQLARTSTAVCSASSRWNGIASRGCPKRTKNEANHCTTVCAHRDLSH
mmetsp:Transcript_12442/g.43946  ORF Transcript_12442/g.43946 Transcript_12442/m.43946 type:complete len:208 (+) Transcript_12442:845-1468(+)